MPSLMLHVACEKVILDKNDLASLISIFRTMNFQTGGAPLPADAVAPQRWWIATMWCHPANEAGKEFFQHTEIVKPDGQVFAAPARMRFVAVTDESGASTQSKNFTEVIGLPMQEGRLVVRVWLEGLPECKAEYELFVKYVKEGASGQTPSPSSSVH